MSRRSEFAVGAAAGFSAVAVIGLVVLGVQVVARAVESMGGRS